MTTINNQQTTLALPSDHRDNNTVRKPQTGLKYLRLRSVVINEVMQKDILLIIETQQAFLGFYIWTGNIKLSQLVTGVEAEVDFSSCLIKFQTLHVVLFEAIWTSEEVRFRR